MTPGWLLATVGRAGGSLVCLAATVLSACGAVGPAVAGSDIVSIPPIPLTRSRMPTAPIPAVLRLPEGKGPFPAVIVLHGCGGRGPSQLIWAARLNAWGYAALVPDSMTPRGVKTVCAPENQHEVTPRDRVGDVGSAIAWLRTRRDIDPARIGVLGLSHGGSTAALSSQRQYESLGLSAAVDYYGPCREPSAQGTVPLLVLAGEEDDWGHPARSCQLYGAHLPQGARFEIHVYPGVYHAFDNPRLARTVNAGHVMDFDRQAAEDSYVRVHSFLDKWLKR